MKFLSIWVLVGSLALVGANAEAAKRLGGGGSLGKQSSNVSQRQAAPTSSTIAPKPSDNAAKPVAAPVPPAPAVTPVAAPKRPWGAMLGGLAAGLGLAWLAHSLGLGGALANALMFGLAALVLLVLVQWVMRSRRTNRGYAADTPAAAGNMPRGYSPENVGNDASARPWERNSTAFDSARYAQSVAPNDMPRGGSMIGSALLGSQTWGVPPDFDTPGFLAACKTNFVTLQDAWDRSDIARLRSMMTDQMLAEIQTQLAEREQHNPRGAINKTDVVMLDAQLLGLEDLGEAYMTSVEFSGAIREDPSAGPSPFREVWNMTKPKSGSTGWLVAGVQALQ